MNKRVQFAQPSPKIIAPQTKMPKIGTKGTSGVLKPLLSSGLLTRIIQTPAETRINANNVPILVISPTISWGTKQANNPTNKKNKRLDL